VAGEALADAYIGHAFVTSGKSLHNLHLCHPIWIRIDEPAISATSWLNWSDDLVDGETVEATHVVMHKNPGCGCCDLWAEHLRSYGFTVESIEDPGILSFKADRNIPRPLMVLKPIEIFLAR
jgi:hypothetical protein